MMALVKLLSVQSKLDFIQQKTRPQGLGLIYHHKACLQLYMSINLKIERYIEKGVNEEVIIHNSIYIFHSFRGHKKDLFHLNYNTLCIIYLHLFYYIKHFNYSETLPYCVLIIYLTVLTFLYISFYSHALNQLNCSAVIIYFIMFLFYYMQCIREILFLLHLINSFTTLHFFCKHLSAVSGRIFVS